jgi:hypothetical protein
MRYAGISSEGGAAAISSMVTWTTSKAGSLLLFGNAAQRLLICWSFLMMWSCRYLFNGLLDDVDIKEDQTLSKGPSESLLRFGAAAQRLLVTDEKGGSF